MIRTALAIISMLLLTLPSASADAGTPTTAKSIAQQQAELLTYARGVLLAELGFSERPKPPEEALSIQRPCFVTFFSGKRVIACFGGFQARTGNLAREIEANIVGALRNYPGANRIDRRAAMQAGVQITFPGELQPISDHRVVDPSREGLFVECGDQGVAIVPQEAKTAAWAYREARRRMGAPETTTDIRIYKFQAEFFSSRNIRIDS